MQIRKANLLSFIDSYISHLTIVNHCVINKRIPFSVCFLLFLVVDINAQNVTYQNVNVTAFGYAENQQYRNYQKASYAVEATPEIIARYLQKKMPELSDSSLFSYLLVEKVQLKELTNNASSPDFRFKISIREYAPVLQNEWFTDRTYSVKYTMKIVLYNRAYKEIFNETFSETSGMKLNIQEIFSDRSRWKPEDEPHSYKELLARLIKGNLEKVRRKYINGYYTYTISLPYIHKAEKKYPELAYLDTLGTNMLNTVQQVDKDRYAEVLQPYISQLQQGIAAVYPSNYELRAIRLAHHLLLLYANYFKRDKVTFQLYYDSVQVEAYKVLGRKVIDPSVDMFHHLLNASLASAKEPVENSSFVTDQMKEKELLAEREKEQYAYGWLVLRTGDTLHGRYEFERAGQLTDPNYFHFQVEKPTGGFERKSIQYKEARTMQVEGRLYEVYAYNGGVDQGAELTISLFGKKELRFFEVVYTNDKIKLLKDNLIKNCSNHYAFIKKGESELSGLKTSWIKNPAKHLREYFSTCPLVIQNIDANNYKWEVDGYLAITKDYGSCQ